MRGKLGKIADVIKVCILSFQRIPWGMCPYFVLVGRLQTLNENNDFCATVIKACDIAVRQSRDAVLLNVWQHMVCCVMLSGILVSFLVHVLHHLGHRFASRFLLAFGTSPSS